MEQNRTQQLLSWMDNLIGEQEQVTLQLLELTVPKRRAIIADDIPALQQINHREEGLVSRLQELEEMRQRVVAELVHITDNEGPVQAEWILALAQQVAPALHSSLKATIAGFARAYNHLIEANQQNSELVHDAIDHIESVIMVISGSTEGVTYSSQGEMGEVALRRYLNKKV